MNLFYAGSGFSVVPLQDPTLMVQTHGPAYLGQHIHPLGQT